MQVMADLDRAKMEFFQNVSHELRTPLTLLLAPAAGPARRRRRALRRRAGRTCRPRSAPPQRLRGMVDALLDFSGAEAGTLEPDRQPIDLAGLTADVASMFRSTAEHAGLAFAVDVPADPAHRAGGPGDVVDGRDQPAGQRGEVHPARPDRHHAAAHRYDRVLTVADTGAGIAPDQQARVFDRFYRAAEPRSAAPASGWPWSPTWCARTRGISTLASTPGWAAPSRSPCRRRVAIDDRRRSSRVGDRRRGSVSRWRRRHRR